MMKKEITLYFEGTLWIDRKLAFELIQLIQTRLNTSEISLWKLVGKKDGIGKVKRIDFSADGIEEVFQSTKRLDHGWEDRELSFSANNQSIQGSIRSSRVKKENLTKESVLRSFYFNSLVLTLPINQYTDQCIDQLFQCLGDSMEAIYGRGFKNPGLYPMKEANNAISYGLRNISWKNYYGPQIAQTIEWRKLQPEFEITPTNKGLLVNYKGEEELLYAQYQEFEKRVGERYFCDLRDPNEPAQEWVVPFLAKLLYRSLTTKPKPKLFDFDYSKMLF